MFIILGHKKSAILTIVFLFISILPSYSSILFIENFEKTNLNNWNSSTYTVDDEEGFEWHIQSGMVIQGGIKGEAKKLGGKRLLIRNNVFQSDNIEFPIIINIDIYPLNYSEKGEMWFGFGIGDIKNWENQTIIVALRKNR